MKFAEKVKATRLRQSGKSYREILKNISVSKSTLSLWLRDIYLTERQINNLRSKRQRAAYLGAESNQNKRIRETEKILEDARKEAYLLMRNPLFISGLMLYWAEGDKSERLEMVKFTNADPLMIKLAMKWFREICKVDEIKFRICIHMHELHCRNKIEEYWSKVTGVPLSQFYKTQVKTTSLGQRRNILYNGTCAVIINSKSLFRKIKGWKYGLIENI
ncbi:MAG: hypothetical protein A2365_02655 [Candidatus Nealsonbacteria bacterium RIFOXYB1_FULL_40_15]|uniref:Uncharacterized protein n=2 Tax=Candidatus Nealsoniibacteriota TaxID=1817911 RepID=A0A1G2EQG1_9BACT|nr:MAG: hypothetical protein A2365_02655 [Candidatus Nealsonbacteria bacterium RIFOXYB1_FULL_40_15]OGZ27498.1 MAG: hypothetical protein A2427_01510 [Candidatus Nealsonbacteria bacterium RIFOXYC1_FULL_40_7]OGZ28154.1 MAG: hypothetical protein A2562_02915 [Candidatus Nealsonbacteria bacterium RIFOXYD1_FULL_39_11]